MTTTEQIKTATDDELQRMTGDPWPWATRDAARDELARRRYVAAMAALQPGDGACYSIGSDRYAVTVIKRTPATITVQMDHARNVGGPYPAQDWEFTPNPDGTVMVFTRRKDGGYRAKGGNCGFLRAGRDHYMDPHF